MVSTLSVFKKLFLPQTQVRAPSSGRAGRFDRHVLKVLHLTDPHIDPYYVEGSNAVCEGPLCCNADSGAYKFKEHLLRL